MVAEDVETSFASEFEVRSSSIVDGSSGESFTIGIIGRMSDSGATGMVGLVIALSVAKKTSPVPPSSGFAGECVSTIASPREYPTTDSFPSSFSSCTCGGSCKVGWVTASGARAGGEAAMSLSLRLNHPRRAGVTGDGNEGVGVGAVGDGGSSTC